MVNIISKSKLKPKILEVLRQVEKTGSTVIVTDHGKPSVKITPYIEDKDSPLAKLRGTLLAYHDPLKPVGEMDWEVLR